MRNFIVGAFWFVILVLALKLCLWAAGTGWAILVAALGVLAALVLLRKTV